MGVVRDPEGNEARSLGVLFGQPGLRVLEIGCGDGRLTWRYARRAGRVVGIDLERDDLRLASIDCPAALTETVGFAVADSVHLPFARSTFDLAIFAWSL